MDKRKQQLEDLAVSIGARLRYPDGRHCCVASEAPRGMVWVSSGVHELVQEGDSLGHARTSIAERMSYGVTPCTQDECEWCVDGEQ